MSQIKSYLGQEETAKGGFALLRPKSKSKQGLKEDGIIRSRSNQSQQNRLTDGPADADADAVNEMKDGNFTVCIVRHRAARRRPSLRLKSLPIHIVVGVPKMSEQFPTSSAVSEVGTWRR